MTPRDASDPALQLVGISKHYGSVTALSDVSLRVEPGEIVGLIGANGAGKSSLLRAAVGAGRFTGRSLIFGRDVADWSRLGGIVGLVTGDAWGHPGRLVRNHIRLMAALAGVTARDHGDLARRFDVEGYIDRRLGSLSLGMRRRVEILCAFLGEPGILLLDEPFNGLDPGGARCLRENLVVAALGGTSVVVASHHLAELEALADRVVFMANGAVIEDTSIDAFVTRHGGRQVLVRAEDNERLADLLRSHEFVCTSAVDALLVGDVTTDNVARIAAEAGILVLELHYAGNGLETAFHGAREAKKVPA
jgi:ABC-2 type transport system ATP-binding protein